jgi:HAD superfamily hydrolase (TIGR01509 family)
MPAVSGIAEDSTEGASIVRTRSDIFRRKYLPTLKPFRDASRLVAEVKRRGHTAVAASSAKADELKPLLVIAGAASLMDEATSSDDAEESKPAPDIIHAAMKRAGTPPERVVMIGDTPYDVEAAQRAGIAVIGFRCGGWDDAALSGAIAIYDGPWDLCAKIEQSRLGGAGGSKL